MRAGASPLGALGEQAALLLLAHSVDTLWR
jgi:hypothetical protein